MQPIKKKKKKTTTTTRTRGIMK